LKSGEEHKIIIMSQELSTKKAEELKDQVGELKTAIKQHAPPTKNGKRE
jgi:hypothetical protein